MASVKSTRAAIASALTGLSALTTALGVSYRVSAYPMSAPTPPMIEVAQFGLAKYQAMGDGVEWWTCVVRGYLVVVTDTISLQQADEFLEDDPVTAALIADPTLDGNVSDLIVDRADQRFWDHPSLEAPIAGVEWQLRLLV